MRHGSLFSGIGGFDLAAEWMGWENIFQVEWDDYAQKVLKKNFPNVTKYTDIKEFDATPYRGTVDIISGGFPCQPYSHAGSRKGDADDRNLWPEMYRVVREIKPTFVVFENVIGIIDMALPKVLHDLEDEGYNVYTFIIPAYAVNALHKRNRVWGVGIKEHTEHTYTNGQRLHRAEKHINGKTEFRYKQIREPGQVVSGSIRNGTDPRIFRVANGIPNRVDRLKGLGNAIVPQVAYEIFKAIDDI